MPKVLIKAIDRLINRLAVSNIWYSIWLPVIPSIFLTEIIVSVMGLILKNEITYDYLLTGFVASLFVATAVSSILLYLIGRLSENERQLEQRIRQEVAKNREKDHLMIQQSRFAAMGEMLGNIAHQWRQPLNALSLLLANIKDAHGLDGLDRETLDRGRKPPDSEDVLHHRRFPQLLQPPQAEVDIRAPGGH